MSVNVNPIMAAIVEAAETLNTAPDDYINPDDGLKYCGKCHTPKEAYFPEQYRKNGLDKHPIACKCAAEERARREAEQRERDAADVTLSPLCGVVRIPLAGDAHIASVRVEDRSGGAVSGLFPFDPATPEIVRNGNFGNLPWVVLDCAGTGGGVRPAASGTEFCVAVPAGDYASGLSVRVTDCAHRSATWEIPGPCAVAAGGVKTLVPLNYAPGEDLLFAEHFDNCVWGCDYAAETGGYGVGAGSIGGDRGGLCRQRGRNARQRAFRDLGL